jgi:hypothetical protein
MMRIGASTILIVTVNAWTYMVGFTIPMPRNADDIASIANCKASAGINQNRYVVPASVVAASAATELM